MILTAPQREGISRVIDAYCAQTQTDRSSLTADQAQTIGDAMGVSRYPNVVEAIQTVLALPQ